MPDMDVKKFDVKKRLQNVRFDSNAFIEMEMKKMENCSEKELSEMFDNLMDSIDDFSETLDEDVGVLKEAVDSADEMLLSELRAHAERLKTVKESVDDVKKNFERASEGAVRIGSRLAATERERSRIETAMMTLDLVKEFEIIPVSKRKYTVYILQISEK